MRTSFDIEEFFRTVKNIYEKAKEEGRLINNPTEEELRKILEKQPGVKKTRYDNFVVESEPTSRAERFTKNNLDHEFGEEEKALLEKCAHILSREKIISLDRVVGDEKSNIIVRFLVPQRYSHLAYGGGNLFLPIRKQSEPVYWIVFFTDNTFESNKTKPLPEKDITIRLAFFEDGRVIKIVRNSTYIGELKKGVFAAEDWNAKKRGGIFLHAGCREDYLQSVGGSYKTIRSLFLALSANGKTTLTSKILAKKEREKSWLIQDDGGTLMPNGSFHGFEGGGLFVKTEGVNPEEQVEIFYGLMKPSTLCENVYYDQDFDFYNYSRTSNGRAVIKRQDFMHASRYINVDDVDNIILITRGPIIPAISKLDVEQAVALMIVGQSMESSAGDPTRAGEIRSVFFYDPFVAGDRAYHANRFYEIAKKLPHINYYLLNTGGIGEGETYTDIKLEHTLAILESLFRGGLREWVDSPVGFKVPKVVRAVDDIYFHPEKLYSHKEFKKKLEEINELRREVIKRVGNKLHPKIKKVF